MYNQKNEANVYRKLRFQGVDAEAVRQAGRALQRCTGTAYSRQGAARR